MITKIYFFEDKYYLFSNWSSHQIIFNNVLFPTAEHAYHYQKFTDPIIKEKILKSKSPNEAKEVSRQFINKQIVDWDKKKLDVMEQILREKLKQHSDVLVALKNTRDSEIIENSPDDYFWGCGKNKNGQNNLGKIWMKLRNSL